MKKFKQAIVSLAATSLLATIAQSGCFQSAHAATVYSFAQQKIYNMTLTGVGLTPTANLSVSTTDAANLSPSLGVTNSLPAIDAQQSKLGTFNSPGAPAGRVNPGENYINSALYFTSAGPVNVLSQANPTSVGVQNGTSTTIPTLTSFNSGDQFARSDVYTGYADGNPVGGLIPGTGQPPAGYPTNGQGVSNNQLFANVGAIPTIGFDSAAETLVNSASAANADANSSWLLTGQFNLASAGAVTLSFDSVERLVVFSDSPFITQVNASNTLTFLITDLSDNPVDTIVGNRSLTLPNAGEATYNWSTTGGSILPRGVNSLNNISFSSNLAAGNYKFSITGATQADVRVVPEPSTYITMGIGATALLGMGYRRRKLAAWKSGHV